MNPGQSSLQTLILFILFTSSSGVLSTLKTIIGFFHRQNTKHAIHNESKETQNTVSLAATLWEKPGFFESISLGRFFLDGAAIITGFHYLQGLFPYTKLSTLGIVNLALCFMISHWTFPVLGQAFSPYLGKLALNVYRVYSFFFMGKLGEFLFHTHDFALRKLGIDPKLSFLGEMDLQKLSPTADEDNPDRSGLEDDEKEMIRSIFDLRETQVKEIMTPRVDMIALEADTDFSEVMKIVRQEKYSRIPIYKENVDNTKGILHSMDMMSHSEAELGKDFKLSNIMREAYFVPRTKKIGELMREFRKKHIHMAIVVDEYGGTAGLITLEDILEEIVGEIHDEDETETLKIHKVEDGVYLIDPIISLSVLNADLNIHLHPDDHDIQIDTLGGFILFVHGKVPDKGDVIPFKDFIFEIMEMEGQKMERIRLTIPEKSER